MPKRNSSNSRRTSSSRSASTQKSFRKGEGESPKSFKKFDKKGPGKAFSSRSDKPSGSRPLKKFDRQRSDDAPLGKKEEYSGDKRGRGGFAASKRYSDQKPLKKGDRKTTSKSFSRRDENASDQKRSFSSNKPERRSSRPFKREDKPFKREDKSFRGEDKPFKREDKSFRGEDKPFKREGKSFKGEDKPFKREGKPFKREDKPFKREDKPAYKKERGFAEKRSSASPRTSGKKPKSFEEVPAEAKKVRLNKFIANSGVCSRREADELITMGLISVNGKTITELGYKVNPGDEVRHESKILKAEKPVYLLLNKPKGYLTTTNDPQERNTVMHLVGNAVKERVYPVGRLDRNTTGLLLLTNDGDLAEKLMHPSYNVKKIYKAELDRPLTKADFQRIIEGVQLDEGRAMVDDLAIISDDGKTVGIELHIGWNRVVRRIFETLDYQVLKLDRSVYAGLDKKDLPRGHWRLLKEEEIIWLKHYK